MNEAGFYTTIEEGEKGQFELFSGEKSLKKGAKHTDDRSFFSLDDVKDLLQ